MIEDLRRLKCNLVLVINIRCTIFIKNSSLTQLYSQIPPYYTEYECCKLQSNHSHLLYMLFPSVI